MRWLLTEMAAVFQTHDEIILTNSFFSEFTNRSTCSIICRNDLLKIFNFIFVLFSSAAQIVFYSVAQCGRFAHFN